LNRQQARDDFRQRSFFVVGWHNNGKQWLQSAGALIQNPF